ncbi:VOC family protein [uncultured Ilumatobacter sp.]|jgi:glyoxylase I family protein|uniref:VOC family protein n=1 Tax=uncultured Ilumatobacter sp. TaxID=879968 RepID=UPI00374E4848|tara:strand:- start:128 stop:484 length:357 start_codon:yes stop_codon:yes gene_type:complete
MQFAGVHHVSLNVTDAAECTRFYVDIVGMTLREDRPDFPFEGAWLQAGEQQVHLLEVAGFVPPKGQHFALRVADLDAAKADLESKGVKASDPSQVGDICRQAFFHDPTGNLIEINQPL